MKNSMSPLDTDLRDAKRRVSTVKGPARKRKGSEAATPAPVASEEGEDLDEENDSPGDEAGSGDD